MRHNESEPQKKPFLQEIWEWTTRRGKQKFIQQSWKTIRDWAINQNIALYDSFLEALVNKLSDVKRRGVPYVIVFCIERPGGYPATAIMHDFDGFSCIGSMPNPNFTLKKEEQLRKQCEVSEAKCNGIRNKVEMQIRQELEPIWQKEDEEALKTWEQQHAEWDKIKVEKISYETDDQIWYGGNMQGGLTYEIKYYDPPEPERTPRWMLENRRDRDVIDKADQTIQKLIDEGSVEDVFAERDKAYANMNKLPRTLRVFARIDEI